MRECNIATWSTVVDWFSVCREVCEKILERVLVAIEGGRIKIQKAKVS